MQKFVLNFNKENLVPVLENRCIENISFVSHSSGDGELLFGMMDLKNQYSIQGHSILINPWDVRDAARVTLENSAFTACKNQNKAEVRLQVESDYQHLYENSTSVLGHTDLIKGQALNAFLYHKPLFQETMHVNAGHTTKGFINLQNDDVVKICDETDGPAVDKLLNKGHSKC